VTRIKCLFTCVPLRYEFVLKFVRPVDSDWTSTFQDSSFGPGAGRVPGVLHAIRTRQTSAFHILSSGLGLIIS